MRSSVLVAGLSGGLFGGGLILSGMTNPANVRAFLDIAGEWNPALALVMAAAIAVAMPAYAWIRRRGKAMSGETVCLPNRLPVDQPLIVGSILFGAGWGLLGVCPGPGMVAAASGDAGAMLFVCAMAAGMWLAGRLRKS